MQINLCFPEKISAGEAEELVSQLKAPALVADKKHIIKYRNTAAYRLPFLRCGAKLERFVSPPFAESLKAALPGTLVAGGAENGQLPDAAALVCDGCVIIVLDALSAKLCGIARERFRALPGYDSTFYAGAESFCGALRDKLGAQTEKRFSDLLTLLAENGAGAFRVFDASKVLRTVIAAADKLLGERGYAAFWHAIPTDLYTEGGEDGFAAIIAASLCACARSSANGWVDVRGSADGRTAQITVSAVSSSPASRTGADGGFSAASLCGGSAAPDLYLARLIAESNRWDLTVSSAPAEGGRRLSATLSFALSGSVTPSEFILHEDLGDRIRAVMKQVFSALARGGKKAK
ncbi:MAG: hypothetical protein J5925_03255 [Clostridia bacterium]|nr:hypothetical protein [Clostridia bacterium]